MRASLAALPHEALVEVALTACASNMRSLEQAMAKLSAAPPSARPFTPMSKTRSSAADGKPDALVIVDPLSTGARLAAMGFCFGGRAVLDLLRLDPDGLRYQI